MNLYQLISWKSRSKIICTRKNLNLDTSRVNKSLDRVFQLDVAADFHIFGRRLSAVVPSRLAHLSSQNIRVEHLIHVWNCDMTRSYMSRYACGMTHSFHRRNTCRFTYSWLPEFPSFFCPNYWYPPLLVQPKFGAVLIFNLEFLCKWCEMSLDM